MKMVNTNKLRGKIEEKTRKTRSSGQNGNDGRTKGNELDYEFVLRTIKSRIADDVILEGNEFPNRDHNFLNCGLDCKYHEFVCGDNDKCHHEHGCVIRCGDICEYKEVRDEFIFEGDIDEE